MRKLFLYISVLFFITGNAQTIFSERFGSLSLSSHTAGSTVSQYTLVPSNFSLIQDNNANNIGNLNNYNVPFHVPALKNSGWVV
ncbi:MAG TPA: hypothetical protein PLU73_10030, partial [Bacteroidia bacterium]|nr:hypothetical protein [Bacteroidia bacterium]